MQQAHYRPGAIRYNDNYRRPCMIIDNPDTLAAVVEEAQPRETCRGGALRLVRDLRLMLKSYAQDWERLAAPVWSTRYAAQYRQAVADAHRLSRGHELNHPGERTA